MAGNKEDKIMDKAMTAIMAGVLALGMFMVVTGVIQAMQPQPPVTYTCPICGIQFATYDELYEHFATEHPTEPIDIIWE